MGADGLRALCRPDGILFDVKYLLPADKVDGRL
jgi:UDP-N-acetyl-D-galactosamine dehydrogenase